MPRYLYLLRHAQSADKQPGQSDFQRELTASGMQQALRIAGFFRDQKSFPEVIYASPAERTRLTAEMIADANQYDRGLINYLEDLYEASTRTFFELVTKLDDKFHQVLFVGHNPAISYLAEYLTKAEIGEILPAGMAIIQFDSKSWREVSSGSGDFVQYVSYS
jgi:phosphohistidine phosphatase